MESFHAAYRLGWRLAARCLLGSYIFLAVPAFPGPEEGGSREVRRDQACLSRSHADCGFDAIFLGSLSQGLRIPDSDDQVGWRLLADYGAMFVARGGVILPPVVTFADAESVKQWQAGLPVRREIIGGIAIELQSPAMEALLAARTEARQRRLRITPRGRLAARRDYRQTEELWLRRVQPGLKHWVLQKRLSQREATRLRKLSPRDQVPEILRLEKQGLFFSTNYSKSILCSAAPPGSSQHLALLALDVKEHGNRTVRAILARHGWFQTVIADLPHFMYLGAGEQELPALGLRRVVMARRRYWVPATGGSQITAPH